MKFLKVALYCLWWLSFACLFIFIWMAISHISENDISTSSNKIQDDWENVNSGNSMWDMQVTFNNSNLEDKTLIEELPWIMLITDVDDFIEVWDTVTFEVLPDNANFKKDSIFYYDFDWNWIWDLVTKQNKIKYIYIDSYEKGVIPRVAVEYEWNFRQAKWETILILEKEWIEIPRNWYEKNKFEILLLLQNKWEIEYIIDWMFKDFEEMTYNYTPEEREKELEKIRNTIIEDWKKNKWLDNSNKDIFTQYFCDIFDYFDIITYTDKCPYRSVLIEQIY